MLKKIITISLLTSNFIIAQNVGINSTGANAHPSAIMDVDAAPSNNKGFLMPRLTTIQRLAIATPATGLQVYDINLKGVYVFDGTWDCLNTPAGTVQYFANTTSPRGYLECNGQSISTTQYPELFTAIGYTYGGAGANFNVPDLRGEFVRGWDNAKGVDVGRALGTAQTQMIENHTHDIPTTTGTAGGRAAINEDTGLNSTANNVLIAGRYYTYPDGPQGAYGPETRPRNIALMPCIKF